MIGPSYLAAAREAYALLPDMADGMPDRVILRWARAAGFGVARWRRPGQWGDRARERRTARLERAAERRAWQRAERAIARVHPNRSTCRALRRHALERRALEWGLTPKPGEPGHVRVTLPASTTPEELADITARVDGHTPAHVLVDVVRAERVTS